MRDDNQQGFTILNKMPIPDTASGAKSCLCGKTYNIPLTQEVLSQHVLFTGAIGSGKTTAINGLLGTTINNMSPKDVMIVFDAKGDFKKKFYRPGRDEIISCYGDSTVTWNMFREVELDGYKKMEANLMELANSLFDEKIKRSNAPFFPMAAKDILYGIMTYILRRTSVGERNNEELYLFLRDAELEDIISGFSEMEDLKGLMEYIYSEGGFSEQTQGVYSELRVVANEMLVGSFKEAGDFSIRSFVRNKGAKILFIEYDLSIGSVLTPIYKTLFDLAIKETLGRSHSDGNVYFVIDEFSLLPHLYHISDGVNFGRSLGAKFIVATQSVQQVIHAYGRELAYSILSSFGTNVFFKTTDKSTLEFVQDHYGTRRYPFTFQGHDIRRSGNDTFIIGKATEDWDIIGLEKGEAIISVASYSPYPVKYKFREV